MKSTKKIISVILTVLMLMSCVSVSLTVNASTGTLCDYYATNPGNKVGVQKTITIDGNASDWTEDMLIAQGAAWDVANHYKGGHENCVLDTYALFASWDNSNLYIGWQMVNTTDTWAREGDGPLSDGGRVLDVPLILALSVDPSSTSMSNKNTSGGSIWGQKMGLEFDQHVDHLLYMSGKPGNGEPAIFTAVDSNGNTDYSSGCKLFKSAGIEYKMAETNICSSIYGLNYSEDTSDVYDSSADWVDYKTFLGSMGTHDTSYDSFYEIKVPLSVLGIDASYIQNYGIGAMLVATRGESGLDCIPFDDTMLDNATDSYSSDASTSAEKDDIDTITSSFARIGKSSGDQPITQPTTVASTTVAPTTVTPTTVAPTTEPASDTLTVNATSNLFSTKTTELSENAKTVTVTYDLKSAMNVVNGQWTLKYDSSKLKLKSDSSTLMPYISDGVINVQNGVIKGNFTNVSDLYDFTSEKTLVQATFEVIGKGTTEVNLDVQELSVGYLSNGSLNYKNAVVNSTKQNLSSTTGFTSSSISGTAKVTADQIATTAPVTTAPVTTTPATTAPVTTQPADTDTLTVNATSNFFPAVSQTYDAEEEQITVSYKLKSSMDVINSEWVLTYDPTKLSFDKSGIRTLMPQVSTAIINESEKGIIKGNFSDLGLVSYSAESDFVSITFDVIGTGVTDVDLFMNILGVAYLNENFQAKEAYVVDFGEIKDVTTKQGFENETYSVRTVLSAPSVEPTTVAPTTQPATQPVTQPVTQPTTQPSGDTLKVTATSNILTPVSKVYSDSDSTVTVTYKLKSAMYIVNGQWQLTYDDTKLSFNASKNSGGISPNIPGSIINTTEKNQILGDFSNLELYDFTTEQTFVTVTFDIIGTGETTIDLNFEILGVAYLDDDMQPIIAYPVDNSQLKDVTGYAGFEKSSLSGKILLSDPGETPIMYGDVDGNGVVNVSDATLVQKYIVKLETLTADQIARADVDHNGTVNISDASTIQKYSAKLITSF